MLQMANLRTELPRPAYQDSQRRFKGRPASNGGRHTFIGHALAGGRTLAEVRDAAGHANVTVTSGYVHVAVEDGAT